MDEIKKRFVKVYIPGRALVVDEIIESFKGRLNWKQFIPSKRERFGMKIFVAAESKTSYNVSFENGTD